MEQALRRLKTKLEEHHLVQKVSVNYFYFLVVWKSGIKERLIINRYENKNEAKRNYYLRSKIRPHFMPPANWWEDISNNKQIKPEYLENVEYEENCDDFSNLINWKWSDYTEARFYERLIQIHEILQYVLDNGWKKQKFPENTLIDSMQKVYLESLKPYTLSRKKGFKLRNYAGKEKPGEKILQHFMPYDYYGNDSSNFLMNNKKNTRKIYLAIRNVINRNKILKKKGRKTFLDFNYNNIFKCMRINKSQIRSYKLRHIGLYRSIIKHFELNGMSYYDPDPFMGECYLASIVEGCPYYFNNTIPFDECSKNLSNFLKTEININSTRCDFSIFDNSFKFNMTLFEEYFALMKENSDLSIIFINNENMQEWLLKHPNPHDKLEMKFCKNPALNGFYLSYY